MKTASSVVSCSVGMTTPSSSSPRPRQAQAAWPPLELTWRWDTGTTELVGRPDHVFVAPRLRVAAVQVMQRGGSDHRPLRVAIEATR